MEITTKFNIGDILFTIDNDAMKITEFKVSRITAFIGKSQEDTCIYYDNSHREGNCFRTKHELMEFIDKPFEY